MEPFLPRRDTACQDDPHEADYSALRDAVLHDIHRPGLKKRLQKRIAGRSGTNLTALNAPPSELVEKVLEGRDGGNAALARKVHARYDRVGLKQPSVEVRFDNLSVTALVPQAEARGLHTVAADFRSKASAVQGLLTCQSTPKQEYKILQNVSGVLKPGRITLMLGPPAGGKSMLMKALCRNTGGVPSLAKVSGDITYNGHSLDEFNVLRTARYVDQHDLHNPLLTVRETLTFSAVCQGPGYHRSMLQVLEKKEAEQGVSPDPDLVDLMSGLHHEEDSSHKVALTLQLLSLTQCAETIVGDHLTRGVSGGERKRVTTGEAIVGPSKVLFMDEISTGLDSASTFTIVQSLANWAHATDSTIVVTLLQPEPQAYDLFDDIMLVSNGRIVYHGPRPSVEPHFSRLGFEVPENKAVADFLQELVSPKDQALLRADRSKFEPSLDFVPAAALAAAFKRSDRYQQMRACLDKPFEKSRSHPAALLKSKYGIPAWDQIKVLLWRERILLTRNKQGQKYRYIQMVVLAVMIATLFVRGEVTNNDSFRGAANVLSVIFYTAAYMQFLGLAETVDTISKLPVFWKQRANLFYSGWAYAVPLSFVRIFITIIEVTAWSLVVYFVTGMESDAGRFFTFWGVTVLLQLVTQALYRGVGYTTRATVLGASLAVVVMFLMFLGSGFVLLRPRIPDWLIWIFWISPLQYVMTGLANNEYLGDSYKDPLPGMDVPLGEMILDAFEFYKGSKWRWIAVLVLLGMFFVLNLLNMAALTFLPAPPKQTPSAPPQEEEYTLAKGQQEAVAQVAQEGDGAHRNGSGNGEVMVHLNPAFSIPTASVTPEERASGRANAPAEERESTAFPFEQITLSFANLRYFVPSPVKGEPELELLKGITGVFRPGVLTALMGASGAGKTTLMDVLADRKTAGRAEGEVRVNGFEKNPETFARVMGYCEQFDVHSSGTTVEEAIRISAALRLNPDEVSEAEREGFVQQCLAMVELDVIGDHIVGFPGVFGLSGEQFKRLTIAVELAANPAIMFLDEPTSGLDARAAQIVMRVVRNIVNSNRTIVCTIHQPSKEIFLKFDELLLLKRGGRTIFYGELGGNSKNLVDYLQAIPGAKQLSRGYNPATYMLEASTLAEEDRLGVDFGDLWEERGGKALTGKVEQYSAPRDGDKELAFKSTYATGLYTQYCVLLRRYWLSYWRDPAFNTTRLLMSVVFALLLGAFFFSLGDKLETTNDVQNIMGMLFITVMFTGFVNFQMMVPTFFLERPVMYRERASALYGVLPWVEALEDVELPWTLVQTAIFSLISYFMIHFEFDAGKFLFYWAIMFLGCMSNGYLGMIMVCATPNLQMGLTLGSTLLGMAFAFAGFMLPRPDMPPWWQWFYFIMPTSWHVYALMTSQLGDKQDLIEVPYGQGDVSYELQCSTNANGDEVCLDTIANYMEKAFDFVYELRWLGLGLSVVFVFILRGVVYMATKYLNFQKR